MLLLATAAIAQPAQRGSRAGVEDTARMEQVIQSYVQSRRFMGAVLVARGTDVVLNKGYGLANVEWEVPNTPATKFRLGSITKQFTAASILLLEERGKLSIGRFDQEIYSRSPRGMGPDHHPPPAQPHLRRPELHEHGRIRHAQDVNTPVEQDRGARSGTSRSTSRSGEKMVYSNSSYLVLGHVIEKLSGGSYEKFAQDNIFTPLGMTDSGYDSNSRIIPRRAAGYISAPGCHGQRGLRAHERAARRRRALFDDRRLV